MSSYISWEPRVSMADIFRLYKSFVGGILDDDLVNDVAFSFYVRCQDIIEVTKAARGQVTCRTCKNVIHRSTYFKEEIITCTKCGWHVTWDEYFASYHRKQLVGGTALPMFEEYVERLSTCSTTYEKFLLIDWVIHQCHLSIRPEKNIFCARPAAINLIDGRMNQIIPFLNNLPQSPEIKMEVEFEKWKKLMMKCMYLKE